MKKNRKILLLAAVCLIGLLVMFILPLLSVPGYSVIRNTLSELGAQNAPGGWIMNFIFAFLALGSIIGGWEYYEGFLLHRFVLVLFGISLTLMAFFNHAPCNPDLCYNTMEDSLHAYFTCTTGSSFIVLSISTSFILERQNDRLLALAAGMSIIFLSVLMSEAEKAAGVWQRLMFIISFGWMVYNFRARE